MSITKEISNIKKEITALNTKLDNNEYESEEELGLMLAKIYFLEEKVKSIKKSINM